MLLAQMKELEKLQMLAGLPSERMALADKYNQFDEETGEPTHDKEGQPLEGKVISNLSAVAWEGLGMCIARLILSSIQTCAW